MMWPETPVLKEDLEYVAEVEYIPWEALKGKTFFITGATGLIGTILVKSLVYADRKRNLGLKIIALVRDLKRAEERFTECLNDSLSFIIGTVEELPEVEGPVDYIIHGASQTASREFVEHAVETINTAVLGTRNLLELAKKKQVKSFVYLSSMEMYGYPEKGHKVTEDEAGALSPLNRRNSYPISKQMCEALCCAYSGEYGVPAKIVRLTQTFGPGVNYNDTRIFAYFARCGKENKDIILKTRGETERCYLYTADAVTAILTVLLKGQNGQAYNAADERTYCSIREMAEKVAKDGGVKVAYEIEDEAGNGFLHTLYMDLDTTLLQQLDWFPNSVFSRGKGVRNPLVEMYRRMIETMSKG